MEGPPSAARRFGLTIDYFAEARALGYAQGLEAAGALGARQ